MRSCLRPTRRSRSQPRRASRTTASSRSRSRWRASSSSRSRTSRLRVRPRPRRRPWRRSPSSYGRPPRSTRCDPMNEQDHDARILALFQVEAAEHIALLNTELLAVEREPSVREEALRKVLRAAHSLKGTAAAAGLTRIEQWMHNWESCAQVIARGEVEPVGDTLDLLYQLLDAVEAE